MTDLSDIYSEFRLSTRSYPPAIPLTESDYFTIFKSGVRQLFIDTGRRTLYIPSELTESTQQISADIGNDEQNYILIASRIKYFQQMLADASASGKIAQHKTDALTVVFGNKGVSDLSTMIADLKSDLLRAFHKMPRFAEGISGA